MRNAFAQIIFNNTTMITYVAQILNVEKTFDDAGLTEAAHDTARNSANCYKAGNNEYNSNPKVEIFSGRIIFSLLVSIFFTFANRGGQ